jgi:hypothetical protein
MHSPSFQVSGVEVPKLRACCSQLANVMVAVCGPEFTLGSATYLMAR